MARSLWLGIAATFAITLSAVLPSAAQDTGPIKIGLIQPTKSLLGKQAVQAAEIAVKLIAEDGGVLGGRQIELIVYDDAFSPVEAVGAAQRLINEDGVKFIAGQFSSTASLAVVPLVEASDVLYVAAVPKHPDVTESGSNRVFRLNSTTAMDAEVFGDFLREDLKPESVAYLGENNDFGRATLDLLKEILADKPNSGIASSALFDVNQSDFTAMLTEARVSGADTLFTGGSNVEQYANVIRDAAEIGFTPKNVILAPGTLNQRVVDLAGEAADGAVSVDIYVPSFDNPLNKRFVDAYQATFGDIPEKTEELSFEAVWLIAKAVDVAGTADDTDRIAEALRGNTWDTPRGPVIFNEKGQAISETFVVEVDGQQIVRR